MNIFSLLASVNAPSGLWATLINWLHSGMGNFGWTILVVTILVKLVTSPLEFFTKLNSKKQTLIQQKLSPQISKIKKKFGANREAVRIHTNGLYKKEGLQPLGGCLLMITNIVVSLVIFFSFYGSLQSWSAYQAITQYEVLEATYNEKSLELTKAKDTEITEYDIVDKESAEKFWTVYFRGMALKTAPETVAEGSGEGIEKTDAECIEIYEKYKTIMEQIETETNKVVVDKWNEIKSDWLWINNIWVADATIYPFLTYDNLIKMAQSGGKEYIDYVNSNIDREEFTAISNIVNFQAGRKHNGFFILAILAAVVTFLQQHIASKHNTSLKSKTANELAGSLSDSMNTSMKVMKFVLPIVMISFVLKSSASFGIYIVASNVTAIAVGEISNLIINKLTKKQQKEAEEVLEKEAERLAKKGISIRN